MSNFTEILAAAERAKGHICMTPFLNAPDLDQIAGRRVFIKAENLQHTGSFKARGGWAAVSALTQTQKAQGVLALSSGNHAQGVARAARAHGVRSVILMPSDAPQIKIQNTRALGGEVVLYDRAHEDRDALGNALAHAQGLIMIKPFDNPMVIAGQGTVGLEIAAQAAEAGLKKADVLVCCGGGGLAAGVALALADQAPHLRARTVEPLGFDDVARSLKAGQIMRNAQSTGSICDAILTPAPGALTFPILQNLAGSGLVVSDDQALHAMALAFSSLKLVLEPGGAVALAAALFDPDLGEDDVIAIASGGNVDPAIFMRALTEFGA